MKYEIYKSVNLEYRWRLKAVNGRTIADSGEGYKTKADCLNGIELAKSSFNAPITDLTQPLPTLQGLQGSFAQARIRLSRGEA